MAGGLEGAEVARFHRPDSVAEVFANQDGVEKRLPLMPISATKGVRQQDGSLKCTQRSDLKPG
jgi:hypothetical protein